MIRRLLFLLSAAVAGALGGAAVSLIADAYGGVIIDPAALVSSFPGRAQADDYERLAREIYAELVALRSTADMPANVKA